MRKMIFLAMILVVIILVRDGKRQKTIEAYDLDTTTLVNDY